MPAKKSAARKKLGAKKTKARRPGVRKAAPARAGKVKARKATAKPARANGATVKKAKPIVKPAAKTSAKARLAKTATINIGALKAKPAAARPQPSVSFDPERRRELIAAAAARRRKTVAKAPPIAVPIYREPPPVERHRFSIGDEVRVVSTSGMWFKHGVEFRVTAALPPQSGKPQYRIKNELEPYERVVSESQLAFVQPHA